MPTSTDHAYTDPQGNTNTYTISYTLPSSGGTHWIDLGAGSTQKKYNKKPKGFPKGFIKEWETQ